MILTHEWGWLLVGVVAQWQSIGTVSQRPWVRFLAVPPFFQALYQPFQMSMDSDGQRQGKGAVICLMLNVHVHAHSITLAQSVLHN